MSLPPSEILERLRQRLPYLARGLQPRARLDELGLDSLDLVELTLVIDELFGVRLGVEDFGAARTVGELAALVASRCDVGVAQP